MSTINNSLPTPAISSIRKQSAHYAPMELFPHLPSRQYNEMTASTNIDVNSEMPPLLDHRIDPILRLNHTDTDDNGILNHLLIPTIHHDYSHHHRQGPSTKGPDSHSGIKKPITGDGETVKIRSELNKTCGPLITLVHVLRDSWQHETNLLHCGIAPNHHNLQISHNTNSKEESLHPNSNNNMATTMTANPFTTTEYFPSRQQMHHASRRSSRIRSRSIAIKRPSKEEQLEEIRQNSLAAEYDWATWRMYNRIIEHRQKHPLPYTEEEEEEDQRTSSNTTESTHVHLERPDTNGLPLVSDDDDNLDEVKLPQQQHYPEYGEVFDLDL